MQAFARVIVLLVAMFGICTSGANAADIDKALAAYLQTAHKCDAPLPDQALLAKYKQWGESPQVPADLKPFVGAWRGVWENLRSDTPLCGIIVITYEAAQPRAVYAVGSGPWVVPKQILVPAQVKEGRLELLDDQDDNSVYASFTRQGDMLVGLHVKTKSPGLFRKVSDLSAEVQ